MIADESLGLHRNWQDGNSDSFRYGAGYILSAEHPIDNLTQLDLLVVPFEAQWRSIQAVTR